MEHRRTQPSEDRGVMTARNPIGQPGPDGVEIDVGHAGDDRQFIQQPVHFEPSLPEPPGHLILLVGVPGDLFCQAFHEP
jgi:hypothetical protein